MLFFIGLIVLCYCLNKLVDLKTTVGAFYEEMKEANKHEQGPHLG